MPASDLVRDLGSGSIGGMCGILASHPLDNAKTKMQATPEFQGYSTWRVLREISNAEGNLALYRGMGFPLCSAMGMNALLFCVQGLSDRALTTIFGQERERLNSLLSGCIAGLIQSPFVNLSEVVKIQRQVNSPPPSPVSLVKERLDRFGAKKGLGQGLTATMPKESFSYGLYFLVYNESRKYFQQSWHMHTSIATFTAGGLAGCAAVGCVHPIDVVKSKVQALPMDTPDSEQSIVKVAREGFWKDGPTFFTRGFTASLYRAFVANAAVFSGYELAMSMLR
mmetsp:Transcript_27361/g.59457  ORF Transcript_27361/g.59457 Transcript_27361/m.59457 type:complete len:281 (-) Transcript_27361:315-1157(-)